MLTPNHNRGVTYQTDEKHLTNLREYFVGVVILACYALNTRLLLRVFNVISLNIYKIGHRKSSLNVTFHEFLTHVGLHHT